MSHAPDAAANPQWRPGELPALRHARSVRVSNALMVSSVRLYNHLGAQGRAGDCSPDEILGGGMDRLTPAFRQGARAVVHDGEPELTWDQVVAELRRSLELLEMEPVEVPVPDDA